MYALDSILAHLFSAVAHGLRRVFRRDNFFFARAATLVAIGVAFIWSGPSPSYGSAYLGLVMAGPAGAILAAITSLQRTMHQLEEGHLPAFYLALVRTRRILAIGLTPLLLAQAITRLESGVSSYYALLVVATYLATAIDLRPPSWIGRLDRKALEALARLTRPRLRPHHA